MKDIYKQKRDEFTKKHLKKYEGEVVDKISFDFNEELKGEVQYFDIDTYRKRMQAKRDRFNSLEDDCDV